MKKVKEGFLRLEQKYDGLGVGRFFGGELKDAVFRVVQPPSKEITETSKTILNESLESLDKTLELEEYIKILHTIEDICVKIENGELDLGTLELMQENIKVNIHFWIQILRDKTLGKIGTKLKFSNMDQIQLEPEEDNSIDFIIENRIENSKELEDKFMEWVGKYNIEELLENGSFHLITNHDQWSTQPITLYLFKKLLGVIPKKNATVVGRRVLTFQKFKFDPEKLIRGQGHVFITDPATRNGRNSGFDKEAMRERNKQYKDMLKDFMSTPGNIITSAPGGTRDRTRGPAKPVPKALDFLEEIQELTTIIPIAFNHGEGFRLEKTDQQVHVDINFGAPIQQGGGFTGEEIWNQVLNILPLKEESPQHSDDIAQ